MKMSAVSTEIDAIAAVVWTTLLVEVASVSSSEVTACETRFGIEDGCGEIRPTRSSASSIDGDMGSIFEFAVLAAASVGVDFTSCGINVAGTAVAETSFSLDITLYGGWPGSVVVVNSPTFVSAADPSAVF